MTSFPYQRSATRADAARQWLQPVLVLLACALLGFTGAQFSWSEPTTDRLPSASWWCLGVLFLLHLARRHAPSPALWAAVPVVLVEALVTGRSSLAVWVMAGDLLYRAVADGCSPRLNRWASLGAALTASAVVLTFVGSDLEPWLSSAGSFTAVVGVCLWWGHSVHQSRVLADQEREMLARAARIEQREALVAQRFRISRDLHDAVSGQLSAIALLSESALAAERAGTKQPDVLPAVRAAALVALDEMRSMIDLLRSTGAEHTPWTPGTSLTEMVATARSLGFVVTAQLPGADLTDLPAAVIATTERGVREAFSNIARYSPGAGIDLDVDVTADRVRVTVTDDGPSRPAEPLVRGAGVGLLGLDEQVTELGGHSTAGPHGAGWRVAFEIPLPPTLPDRSPR